MTLELQAELLRRYPKFFRKPGKQDDMAPFDERGVECGDGWFALIDRLCRAHENEIEMMASRGMVKERWPRVAQIKEKAGSLRFYIRGTVSEELREEKCGFRSTRVAALANSAALPKYRGKPDGGTPCARTAKRNQQMPG